MSTSVGIFLPLTSEQVSFLEGQTGPFVSKQAVIRGLIDSQMRALADPTTLESEHARASFPLPSSNGLEEGDLNQIHTVPSEQKHEEKIAPKGALCVGEKKAGETKPRKANKVKRPKYTEAFEEFWAEYQKLPKKANQTKFKAFEVFEQVIDFEHPSNLIKAAQLFVEQQQEHLGEHAWCMTAPDCFRWLKDDAYSVLLENHRAAAPKKPAEPAHPAYRPASEVIAEQERRAQENIARLRAEKNAPARPLSEIF